MLSACCCCYLLVGLLGCAPSKIKIHLEEVVRTYENEDGLTQKPREKLLSTPAEKNTLSVRHTLNTARIAPRPRPLCPDGLSSG